MSNDKLWKSLTEISQARCMKKLTDQYIYIKLFQYIHDRRIHSKKLSALVIFTQNMSFPIKNSFV